jgi:PadR family transcriptional regulator, regulatory protein PadR
MPDRKTATAKSSAPHRAHGARPTRTADTEPGTAPAGIASDGRNQEIGRPEPSDEREPFPGWPPRDILPPFVLLAVSLQRAHGYVIEDYLRALGLFGITMSTLYRTLRQMEKDGFLASTWEPGPTGPARRVYTITDAGHTWLDSSAAMLSTYRETIDRFFGLYHAGPGSTSPQPDEPTNEKETHA